MKRDSSKKSVWTFTASPTLDLGGVVEHLTPNEKSYVYNQTKSPGGNGINAARILTRLRIPTVATGFLGGGIGEEIQFLLDQERVKNQFIPIRGHSRIGVTVSNRQDHYQTRLTFPGPEISYNEKQAFFRMIESLHGIEILVIGGSLPKGFQASNAKKLMKIAQKKNVSCFVDCPGNILRELIPSQPYLIKPNLIEFQEAMRTNAKTIRSVRKQAIKLLEKIPYLCISSVEDGALFITRSGTYFGRIPNVKIRSTVGAGDSMVGAMTAQFFKKNGSDQDILRWGLAASAATLSHPSTALGTAKEIETLYIKTVVEAI